MPYIPFTDEEIERANSVSLEEYLSLHGERLLRSGSEKRLTSNHSITVRGSEWYDHATGIGGGAILFLEENCGMDFRDAVQNLLNDSSVCRILSTSQEIKPEPEFVLPKANSDMRRAFAYLTKERCLSSAVVSAFAHAHLIYEDAEYRNAIFVGLDENGTPRHAAKHGTFSKNSFRGNVLGSKPQYSFHWNGTDDKLFVFESPIDLLSFISMNPKNWQEHSYAALCGISNKAMLWMLSQNPALTEIALCLDNDRAGNEAVDRHRETLKGMGYGNVTRLTPKLKDWNDDLKAEQTLLQTDKSITRKQQERAQSLALS